MISQIIFYYLINTISNSASYVGIYVVSVASAVGVFITLKINDRFSKDTLYVNVLFSDDLESMKQFHNFLTDNKITHSVQDTYTKDLSAKTLTITAFAETKNQSKMIDNYVNKSKAKIKRIIQ